MSWGKAFRWVDLVKQRYRGVEIGFDEGGENSEEVRLEGAAIEAEAVLPFEAADGDEEEVMVEEVEDRILVKMRQSSSLC